MRIIMKRIILLFALLLFLTGCYSSQNNFERIDGIIDACYTVSEYNPPDADARIYAYLTAKIVNKEITEDVAVTIEKCVRRSKANKK